jgi:regulator of replication initiation timing
MPKTAVRTELESIDRLEEKLKKLVALVERLRSEHASAASENQRLSREIERLTSQLSSSDALSTELAAMREERDIIRTRVSDMLEQLESLNL